MMVLSDTGFQAAAGDPAPLKLCPRGEWEDRRLVATVLSRLTLVGHLKKVRHRGWASLQARLAFTMAAFNVLVQWHSCQPRASGFVPLSIAEFSLSNTNIVLGLSETNTIGYYPLHAKSAIRRRFSYPLSAVPISSVADGTRGVSTKFRDQHVLAPEAQTDLARIFHKKAQTSCKSLIEWCV
jgi:hypothetical protein